MRRGVTRVTRETISCIELKIDFVHERTGSNIRPKFIHFHGVQLWAAVLSDRPVQMHIEFCAAKRFLQGSGIIPDELVAC